MDQPDRMVELFRRELELCKVHPGETVAVLSAGSSLRHYAAAFLAAVKSLGADALDVHLPAEGFSSADERLKNFGKNRLREHPGIVAKLKSCDMVVDLLVASFSKECAEIRKDGGPRMLCVCEDFETLERLFPTPEHRARTEASFARLRQAETFRFTNPAGSDVSYRFGGRYTPLMEYGYTCEPGRWDHWPAGLIANCAEDVNGRVVMDEGDIVYPAMKFLSSPIEFDIEGGRVRAIRGGRDADELRRWMDAFDDPRAYCISHVGWGTHTAAQWSVRGIGMDGRSAYGTVLFSLGPDHDFGGENNTQCHLDLPMRGCSAWLDGEKIISNGRILPEDMRAAGF